jgi:hypothetical protein
MACTLPYLHVREGSGHCCELVEHPSILVELLVDLPIVPGQYLAMQLLSGAHGIHHDEERLTKEA